MPSFARAARHSSPCQTCLPTGVELLFRDPLKLKNTHPIQDGTESIRPAKLNVTDFVVHLLASFSQVAKSHGRAAHSRGEEGETDAGELLDPV